MPPMLLGPTLRRQPPRRARTAGRGLRAGGFTLIELGIVIAVAAILAAAIVPSVIETARDEMAERTAMDIAVVHDAARLFFVQNTNMGGSRWPGEQVANQCAAGFVEQNAVGNLVNGGYLANGAVVAGAPASPNFLRNPWGQQLNLYVAAPAPAPGGVNPGCTFGVATNVPGVVSGSLVAFLPMAGCNPAGGGAGPCPAPPAGPVPPDMVRCCSSVSKPGVTFAQCPAGQRPRPNPPSGVIQCLP